MFPTLWFPDGFCDGNVKVVHRALCMQLTVLGTNTERNYSPRSPAPQSLITLFAVRQTLKLIYLVPMFLLFLIDQVRLISSPVAHSKVRLI